MGAFIDETGNSYGKWTVLRKGTRGNSGGIRWLCECDCGVQGEIVGGDLRGGKSKSCGCSPPTSEHFINETGNRHGSLVVLERAENSNGGKAQWVCQCDCGVKVIVSADRLRRGITKSCGCLRSPNEVGKKYGMLTVLSQESPAKDGHIKWKCRCGCGEITIVSGNKLRSGDTKSCSCAKSLEDGEAAFNKMVRGMIKNAKIRNLTWDISCEQLRELTKQNCHYCGIEPLQCMKSDSNNGDYIYNGLDRADNSKGYELDNVVPCCGRCNRAKNAYNRDDFLLWIEKVYKYSVGD